VSCSVNVLGLRAAPNGRHTSDAEDEIIRAPDIAHAAVSEQRHHPVAAGEHFAGGERRGA
jgi:hypothetical protein